MQQHLEEAKNLGNDYNKDVREDPVIKQHLSDLTFFAHHELLPDSAKQSEIFKQEVQT